MKKLSKPKTHKKSFLTYFLIAFLIVFALAIASKVYLAFTNKPQVADSDLMYTLSPEKTELMLGDKVSIPVYLSGDSADTATAFDLKLTYDKSKLKLTGSKPGDFYDKYLTVKWDDKEAWYALAMTPTSPRKYSDPESPLFTLEFTAVGKTSSTTVSTAASTVYIAETGGFHPQKGVATFKIQ